VPKTKPSKKSPQPPTPPAFTTAPVGASTYITCKPETYRLPRRGGDVYFGLMRGWYYNAEKQGLIRLIRLRSRGKHRGVTLVPYDDVKKLIEEARK